MLTAGDALAKILAKSQKVTFWSQKNGFGCFFFCSLLWMLLYILKFIYALNFLSFFLMEPRGINTPNSFRVLTVRDSHIPIITTTLRRNSRFA